MDDQLIFTIEYETPPIAEEVGTLFIAIARDYRDFTSGRHLAVVSIEQGSIIATFRDWALITLPYAKDAVEVAKGAKALADFGKLLKEGIEALREGKPKKLPSRRGRKTKAERSIDAALKIAAVNGRAVRVKHVSKNGETFEVELSAPKAIEIQAKIVEDHALNDVATIERIATDQRPLPKAVEAVEAVEAVGRLYAPSSASLSASEAQTIIDVVVGVLQGAGLSYVLPQIAADLSSKGLFALASALEHRLRPSGPDIEPPVTS